MTEQEQQEYLAEMLRMQERYKAGAAARGPMPEAAQLPGQPAGNAFANPTTPEGGPDLDEFAYAGTPSPPVTNYEKQFRPTLAKDQVQGPYPPLQAGPWLGPGARTAPLVPQGFTYGDDQVTRDPNNVPATVQYPSRKDLAWDALSQGVLPTVGSAAAIGGTKLAGSVGHYANQAMDLVNEYVPKVGAKIRELDQTYNPVNYVLPRSLPPEQPKPREGPAEATVRPYDRSWREQLRDILQGPNPSPERRRTSEGLTSIADMASFNALSAQEAAQRGDYQGAALAAVPIPGAKGGASLKNLIRRPPEGPATHPSLKKAIDDTMAKNIAIAEQQPLAVPAGPEFEPWRIGYGNYKLAWDQKKKNYYPQKVEGQAGDDLAKEIRSAEKALPKMERIFTPEDVFPQPSRPMDFPMKGFAKGDPDWVTAQLGPARDKAAAAIQRAEELGGPMAGRFYELGRPYEDITRARGKEAGEAFFDQWGQHMGATTSFARPPSNFRMAAYQQARTNQGLPVEELPPYPYGHMYWTTTHRPGVENLRSRGGFMDPERRPKGTLFGGDLTGLTDETVIDQVESLGMGLVNKSGTKQSSPPGQSYPAFKNMRDQLARDLGMSPKVAQAKSWAGFQKKPEQVRQYSEAMLKSMEDRILVTAKITGRDPRDVYQDWVKSGLPPL